MSGHDYPEVSVKTVAGIATTTRNASAPYHTLEDDGTQLTYDLSRTDNGLDLSISLFGTPIPSRRFAEQQGMDEI